MQQSRKSYSVWLFGTAYLAILVSLYYSSFSWMIGHDWNKDDYTYLHSVAVCALMIALGRQLGLEGDTLKSVGMGGLLHDVGKMLKYDFPHKVINHAAGNYVAKGDNKRNYLQTRKSWVRPHRQLGPIDRSLI